MKDAHEIVKSVVACSGAVLQNSADIGALAGDQNGGAPCKRSIVKLFLIASNAKTSDELARPRRAPAAFFCS